MDTDSLLETLARELPSGVINAAAYTAVDQAESEQEMARAVNNEAAGRLAAICKAKNFPLIHISTDYVFDGLKGAPYVETDETSPVNVYGKTKLDGERAVWDANPEALIVRTAWVHSPYGHSFTKTMMRLLIQRDEVSVVDDQFGSPSYAPHLAETLVTMMDHGFSAARHGGERLYHLAGTGHASRLDWVKEIAGALEEARFEPAVIHPVSSNAFPTSARRPPDTRLDCSLVKEELGLALPDWREGVRACVKALLQHHGEQA